MLLFANIPQPKGILKTPKKSKEEPKILSQKLLNPCNGSTLTERLLARLECFKSTVSGCTLILQSYPLRV